MNLFGKNIKSGAGFTLIEILVSAGIFSIVIGVATAVLVSSIKSQRRVLAQQELSDQASYALEKMSRALRMVKKDFGTCLAGSPVGTNYETNSDRTSIRFINYEGKCQEFFLEGGQLKEKIYMDKYADEGSVTYVLPLTSPNFTVTLFKIAPAASWGQYDNIQPSVTLFMGITGQDQIKMQFQTTVSQRDLDIDSGPS